MLGSISSWSWGSGLKLIFNIFGNFGAWIGDLLNYVYWALIHAFANICDGIYNVILYIISPEALELFSKESTISKFYNFSYILGFFLVLLFAGWQIFKTYIEPDKAPPLKSIIWETGKCVVIITLFLFIFNTGLELVSSLQETMPKVYNLEKNNTEGNDSDNNDKNFKFSSNIIASFITLPKTESKFAKEDLIEALNRNGGSCNDNGVSFWGCKFTNYQSAGTFNLKFRNYSFSVDSKKIKEDNEVPAAMFNWRDSISNSILTKASPKKGYLFEVNYLLLLISIIVFTVIFFFTSFSLVTRILELLCLLIVGPAVVGSSVCRQETRITLWKTLIGLLLQSISTLLVIYLSLSFMTTISNMDAPAAFVNKPIMFMLLKCILIFGLGTFMLQGSKVLSSFISETSGMQNRFMGGIAAVAAGIGIGKLAKAGLGVGVKGISGAASLGSATRTGLAKMGLSRAEKSFHAGKPGSKEKLDRATAKFSAAKDKGNRYTTDENGNTVRKNNLSNNASYLGDRLLGKSKKDINEMNGSFADSNRIVGIGKGIGRGISSGTKSVGGTIKRVLPKNNNTFKNNDFKRGRKL